MPQSPEEVNVPGVVFLGEQDGVAERELKAALINLLASFPHIQRAYLVKVSYGEQFGNGVALCLRLEKDYDQRRIAQEAGKVFASIFGTHEHLDIIFVNAEHEHDLASRCGVFFPGGRPT